MKADDFDLDAKYRQESGTVLLTGTQALVRLVVDQRRADRRRGLNTATFISGYQGSPLGMLDITLERNAALLAEHDIVWTPGINEDLAATAIWGSQQPGYGALDRHDGVVGMWYGKGPGLDRSGDVFKHANFMGVGENGGVLALGGDDPLSKSSTLPTDVEPTFYDAGFPILYPGTVQEVLDLGLHGFELSRYSGFWVGFKILTTIADGLSTIDVDAGRFAPVLPELEIDGQPWRHVQRPGVLAPFSLEQERDMAYGRLEAVKAYVAANGLNRIEVDSPTAWLGIVAAGRTFYEMRQALHDLGLGDRELADAGVRLLRLGVTYPLEPRGVRAFANGLEEILVVEEKRAFVELFLRDLLYSMPDRPRVVGKTDDDGQRLVPVDGELTADRLAPLLAARLGRRISTPRMEAHLATLETSACLSAETPLAVRKPFFCSGCPHNRSTNLPDGSVTGAGVGCHAMTLWMDRQAVNISHMGGEGAQWIGRAPFTDRQHMFQNIGDGTFFHSGSLSIRAAVAAGVNVTYKLLYNRAVAMTGGQDVAGAIPVPQLTHHLHAEGVRRIIVCADDVDKYGPAAAFAPITEVWQRDRLDEAQRVLRDVPGVTVLVYDQQCAAEKRRDRKRGILATPDTRIFINERVCEGCGDCGVKSNCLSVQPVETEFGRKTRIHQSSCNFDFTCVEGDCPAFVKVTVPPARGRGQVVIDAQPVTVSLGATRRRPDAQIDEPRRPTVDDVYSIYMTGVGGTGVVTVSQVLATAALLDGYSTFALDQTGLAQKGGPVVSHVKVFAGEPFGSNAIGAGHADAYLGFDLLVAATPANLAKALPNRTLAVVSTSHVPTGDMVANVDASFPEESELLRFVAESTAKDENVYLDANAMSGVLFTDHMPANFIVLGAAYQAGAIPISAQAIERAIELNGVAVRSNVDAFRWGRRYVIDRESVPTEARVAAVPQPTAPSLDAIVERRVAELTAYQNQRLASDYRTFVDTVRNAEEAAVPGSTAFTEGVARHLFKLMAYKDEYEVARLYLADEYRDALADAFPDARRVSIQLHPPVLRALGLKRKLSFGRRSQPALRALRRMRGLRGTRLDPFGYAKVRRVERALIEEYRAMVTRCMGSLSADTHAQAVRLANLPDMIRGYEQVKLDSVARYRQAVADELATTSGTATR